MSDNGYTNKEMLNLLLKGQTEMQKEINQLFDLVNTKPSRMEITGWITAFAVLFASFGSFLN
tara:strand:- start:600 stop:785 length:186 start_codon:yes stop_codon:yes gene_type:complete